MNTLHIIIIAGIIAVPVMFFARVAWEKFNNLKICPPKKKAKVLFYARDFDGIDFSVWECDETR